MKPNGGTIVLLCVVSSMAVALVSSQQVFAADLACCHETTLECVNGGGGPPQFCPGNCPPNYRVCDSEIGPCRGDSIRCQVGCTCYSGIDTGCCLVLGGQVVRYCYACMASEDADAMVIEGQEDDGVITDEQPEEEPDVPSPISKAWVLALPLFLLAPVVPVMLRRRRNT